MLKFRNSNLSKLISSLEDFKTVSRKFSQIQSKVFRNLDEWASESNNTAINDVTNKLTTLYTNLEVTLNEERITALQNVTDMFIKFKEYDLKVNRHYQNLKTAKKLEKKCKNDIKKCPSNRSVYDYEIKHSKAKEDVEFAEFKANEIHEDIAGTKSILFKTEVKRMNLTFTRQIEAEMVILTAMKNLLEKIPDVSNEEVDDINQIKYTKHAETSRICTRASKKLSRLSTTQIQIEPLTKTENSQLNQVNKPATKLSKIKSKIFKVSSAKITEESTTNQDNKLYPSLKGLNDELNRLNLQPPPTYSDSESFYSNIKVRRSSVVPSAPSFEDIQNKENLVDNDQ